MPVHCQGWLYKEGKLNKAQKKRYCVLVTQDIQSKAELQYYEDEARLKLKGKVDLQDAKEYHSVPQSATKFEIVCKGRVWKFECLQSQDRIGWINSLEKVFQRKPMPILTVSEPDILAAVAVETKTEESPKEKRKPTRQEETFGKYVPVKRNELVEDDSSPKNSISKAKTEQSASSNTSKISDGEKPAEREEHKVSVGTPGDAKETMVLPNTQAPAVSEEESTETYPMSNFNVGDRVYLVDVAGYHNHMCLLLDRFPRKGKWKVQLHDAVLTVEETNLSMDRVNTPTPAAKDVSEKQSTTNAKLDEISSQSQSAITVDTSLQTVELVSDVEPDEPTQGEQPGSCCVIS